ncbi:MAG TPA: winged helix-turn-helix domain-containing protein [Steroidobacteraceae bacterium]|nr:winged helix-turn-helix domain-containing protein [Steroidobacteraceae bacterium]
MSSKLRFDGWVLDPESGELERAGKRIRLQEQPVLVLRELITHAGSVVTREQLITLLWPKGVVDFDTGLNTVIRKLRGALGDPAETPRYIETLPRRGYRFIGTLDPDPDWQPPAQDTQPPAQDTQPPAQDTQPPAQDAQSAPRPTPTGQEQAAADEAPSLGASPPAAWAGRPRPLALVVIAGLAVAALLVAGYALWRARSAGATSVRVETPAAALPARTVAVLPFENLSAEPNDGFLATGIAEGVLHRLAAVKSLSVIARTSSFTFRGRDVDARDIGRRLNARYLVEGSVQRAGDRLRVTAQLLDASSGSDLWSLRFDRQMGDIFEVQDEISGKVTDALAVTLEAAPANSPARATPKLDAYLAFIEGRSLLSTYKIADARTGVERLRRATDIDPTFAAAYAEEAHGLRLLSWLSHPDDPIAAGTEKQAAALVDKAVALDPELGEAWVERASGRAEHNQSLDATTEADFRKGLALAPNYAQGYEIYGEWLRNVGRADEGLAMIERARQLDPLAPRAHYMKGMILLQKDDVDGAVPLFLEALRVNPTYHPALIRLGVVESVRGNFAEAAKLKERAIVLDPKADWMRVTAAGTYIDLEDAAAARDVLSTVAPAATVSQSGMMQLCLSIYLRDTKRAAAELYALPHDRLNATLLNVQDFECPSDVIRDDAFDRHDYGRALRVLQVCLVPEWDSVLNDDGGLARTTCAVRYASLLMASGERARAVTLLHALLKGMDDHKAYGESDVAVPRSAALALLGDTDGALKGLEAAFALYKFGWWYELERSPDFKGLHTQPRFQSLVRQYQEIVAKQSALLAGMRKAGEVPYRPAQSASTTRN